MEEPTYYYFHTKFTRHHRKYVPYRFDLDMPYLVTANASGDGWDIHELAEDGVTKRLSARAANQEEREAFEKAWHEHRDER
jgi:hypothetical protein